MDFELCNQARLKWNSTVSWIIEQWRIYFTSVKENQDFHFAGLAPLIQDGPQDGRSWRMANPLHLKEMNQICSTFLIFQGHSYALGIASLRFCNLWLSVYSQVPNKRGVLISRDSDKIPKFNKWVVKIDEWLEFGKRALKDGKNKNRLS